MLYNFIFTFCRKKIRSKSLLIKRKQVTVFSADIVQILAVFFILHKGEFKLKYDSEFLGTNKVLDPFSRKGMRSNNRRKIHISINLL
jgi:hypothetical protein